MGSIVHDTADGPQNDPAVPDGTIDAPDATAAPSAPKATAAARDPRPKTDTTMDDFLKLEYQGCLDLLKYYDERHLSLVKVTTAVSSSVISLIFGFYTLSPSAHPYFWHFSAVLTGIAAVGLLTIFAAMVQNRLYFIYPTRQVNAIRHSALSRPTMDFSNNQMYLATDINPFKPLSLHTLMNFLVALQVGALFAFSWFAISVDFENVAPSILQALLVAGAATLVLFALSALYLTNRGQYHPDKAVHLRKEPVE